MDITLSFLLFSFIILLYWVITELFTFFFRLTGLPDDRARFQVLSLLTGTGFTTRESELILGSRRRRRLARVTMLFGYVFNVTIVSALVNVFLSMKLVNFGAEYFGVLIPLFTIGVILVFLRVPKIRAWGENLFRRVADRVFDQQETFNAVMLLDYIGTESIVQVTLRHIPEEYRGLSLAETRLRAETGILVMLVEHRGGKTMPAQADTVFEEGDKLTVFGDYSMICKTFHAKEHFADD
ncbi:MAG: TrkA C-terminal domain-containing protein [Clostridia bacterium]|nr:TrkA C-terminal domain-containing protein [Clostridia bacterium]